jgi:hypothetical protein
LVAQAPVPATFRRIRRLLAALLLVLYVPACYHWVTPEGMTPQEYIATNHPKQVRITLADSSRLVVLRPTISGDSLVGFRPATGDPYTGLVPEEPVCVAAAAVQRLQVRRLNVVTTVVAPLLGLVAVGATAAVICVASDCIGG